MWGEAVRGGNGTEPATKTETTQGKKKQKTKKESLGTHIV